MNARSTLALALVLVAALVAGGHFFLGPVAAAVFAVAFLGGLVAWRLTTYGWPADPGPLVVPYLLTVILFIVHVGEEYFTEFWAALSSLSGGTIPQDNFVLVAALVGPVLWLGGLTLLYLRTEIGNWLAWVFVVAMTVSELAHFVFPFVAEGRLTYFSGLYTAALPLIPAWVLAVRLVRDARRASVPGAA